MQNVFPARELYNSNPCRDLWDSEQLSQIAGSQGSQNGSSDMFSQSRMSQLKGLSSFDVWSQPSNSQQLVEDEPMKYYMKYMTKPPLFSESERQSQKMQKPPQTVKSYKEMIEIQKKQTAERDDRDVLDSFISLLKDYTKEVKTAMDSFKDSIDSTLASKAEQVATAAKQSANLIKKLKDDLLESFGCLRKDLKENEDLKEIITKQNEKIAEQDSQIKILQSQLKDCLTREEKLTEKHEKHMEREDKVLQKLDEISSRQASTEKGLLLQRSSTVGNTILNQSAKCVKDDIIEYVSQNPPNRAFRNQFAWNITEVPNVRLHHMAPKNQPVPQPSIQNIAASIPFNHQLQGSNNRQLMPSLDCQYYPQPSLPHASEADAVVPSVNIQYQTGIASGTQHQPNVHPTAAIAPMRPNSHDNQQSSHLHQTTNMAEGHALQQDGPITGGGLIGRTTDLSSAGDQAALPSELEAVPVSAKYPEENVIRPFTSPGVRVPTLTNAAWPKQSPIAAVHPQIRVKRELESEKMKASRPCAKGPRKEDPFDIFVFDLTSSPEDEICEIQKSKPASLKTASQSVAITHRTRSKTIKSLKNAIEDKTTVSIADSNDVKNQGRSKSKINSYLPSVKKRASSLYGKISPASKHYKGAKDNTDGYSLVPTTPNRPVIAAIENGIPRSKIAKSVFQGSKTSFKRNQLAAKRKLSFDASELFEGLEDDTNIQQITESIRKHSQRKRVVKVL